LFKNIHPSFKIVTHGNKLCSSFVSHVNTDEDGFVKKMTYTPGNVHDSKEFDKLLGINKHKHKNKIKTWGEVYADSAYIPRYLALANP
jgi:IS5 family transposase